MQNHGINSRMVNVGFPPPVNGSGKVRDIFDFAAVLESYPDRLRAALSELEDKLPLAIDRIGAMRPRYAMLAMDEINPTDAGARFMRRASADAVLKFLQSWTEENPAPTTAPPPPAAPTDPE